MRQYHELKIAALHQETSDSRRLCIEVPEALQPQFAFLPGQHLPIAFDTEEGEMRRTYSICSTPGEWPLEIGVRLQDHGQFSDYVANSLKPGDAIRVMPPFGRFHPEVSKDNSNHYAGFAAGSGITPILSMIKCLMRDEPASRFTLFYGNRKKNTTMFVEDLYALKNQYPERLQLHFLFTQEEQEFDVAGGRLDADKVRELGGLFFRQGLPDAAFLCGPDTMIEDVTTALKDLGMDKAAVHSEHFGAPRKTAPRTSARSAAGAATVTVIMDGHRSSFQMAGSATSIVDAAAEEGIDLPYSCKGGVCATCRTHVQQGEVDMAINYGLEPWEVEAGFVLACQSRPVSDDVTLDYDKT